MDSESLIDLTMTTELFESISFSDILITPTPSIDIIMCSPTPILEGIFINFIYDIVRLLFCRSNE